MYLDQLDDIFQGNSNIDYQFEDHNNQIVQTCPKKRFQRFNEIIRHSQYKIVSRGYDAETGREICWHTIKFQHIKIGERKKILKQIALMRNLNHKCILKCIDSWVNQDTREIVYITELMNGGMLKNHLRKIKPPKLKVIKSWCQQILSGINYLHSCEQFPILHKNIKCENLYINTNSNQIKIGELGIYISNSKYHNSLAASQVQYEPPEFAEGKCSRSADIYSFGMMLLEIVTLKAPYSQCISASQIYKKIINNIKPSSLEMIVNQQLKNIIFSCIGTQSQRPSIKQLIENPFWKINQEKDNFVVALVQDIKGNEVQKIPFKYQQINLLQIFTNGNQKLEKNLQKKNTISIHVQEEQKITKINNLLQMRQKQNQIVFNFTINEKKQIEIKISKLENSKESLEQFIPYFISKFDQKNEKINQTTEFSNQIKSEADQKKIFIENRKTEQFIKSHELIQFNDILNIQLYQKIKQIFHQIYEDYQSKIENLMIQQNQLNLQEILENRFQIQKKQLQLLHFIEKEDKQKKKIEKKLSRIVYNNNNQSSPSDVLKLIDILNLQDRQISLVDKSQIDKCQAFKNIMKNGDIAFNDSSIYNIRDQLTNNVWLDNLKNESSGQILQFKHEKNFVDAKMTQNLFQGEKIKNNQIFIIQESKEEGLNQECLIQKVKKSFQRIEVKWKIKILDDQQFVWDKKSMIRDPKSN